MATVVLTRSSMAETNPYVSPKTACPPASTAPSGAVASRALRLLAFGLLVGTGLGILACWVLSNENAASHFYLTYGSLGAIAGVLGSMIGGVVIGIMRLKKGVTRASPTTAARKVAPGDQPAADE